MKYHLVLAESKMFVIDKQGKPLTFSNYQEANIERIYLQPDIEDRIMIKEV